MRKNENRSATQEPRERRDATAESEKPLSRPAIGVARATLRGTPWSRVDISYLDWIVYKATDMDEDVKFTARYWLNRRRADDR